MLNNKIKNLKIKGQISHGAFGEIFKAKDTVTGLDFALKIEKKTTHVSQLKHEYNIYKKLKGPTTPAVYEYGRIDYGGTQSYCMAMELMGPSLEKIFSKLNRKFSTKTIFLIAKSCLSKIEYLHHRHYIHRDIKPDNFCVDLSMKNIHLIDYGLAKEYRNPITMVHRPYKDGKNLTGTARYASLNTHAGVEQSRRDDLESLGFLLIYFCLGRLPWQGLAAETKQAKYEKIFNKKRETTLKDLCLGVPSELFLYMTHVRNLKYAEYPDYFYLTRIFDRGLDMRGEVDDGKFDWIDNPVFKK